MASMWTCGCRTKNRHRQSTEQCRVCKAWRPSRGGALSTKSSEPVTKASLLGSAVDPKAVTKASDDDWPDVLKEVISECGTLALLEADFVDYLIAGVSKLMDKKPGHWWCGVFAGALEVLDTAGAVEDLLNAGYETAKYDEGDDRDAIEELGRAIVTKTAAKLFATVFDAATGIGPARAAIALLGLMLCPDPDPSVCAPGASFAAHLLAELPSESK